MTGDASRSSDKEQNTKRNNKALAIDVIIRSVVLTSRANQNTSMTIACGKNGVYGWQ